MNKEPSQIPSHRVALLDTGRVVMAPRGAGVLDVVHDAGIHISATCRGKGTCGPCRVVVSGQIPAPTAADEKHLPPAELARGVRLTAGSADLKTRLQVAGVEDRFDVDSMVRVLNVKLAPVSLSDTRADLERLFQALSGAFGAYINLTNAVRTGLIPVFANADHQQIGNAAAVGARQALVNRSARERAVRIAGDSRHIELMRHKNFNRLFAEGMLFPESGMA